MKARSAVHRVQRWVQGAGGVTESALAAGPCVLYEKLLVRAAPKRVVQLIVVRDQVVERLGVLPAKCRGERPRRHAQEHLDFFEHLLAPVDEIFVVNCDQRMFTKEAVKV